MLLWFFDSEILVFVLISVLDFQSTSVIYTCTWFDYFFPIISLSLLESNVSVFLNGCKLVYQFHAVDTMFFFWFCFFCMSRCIPFI